MSRPCLTQWVSFFGIVEGLGPSCSWALHSLVNSEAPMLAFLMETKLEVRKMEYVSKMVGFHGCFIPRGTK